MAKRCSGLLQICLYQVGLGPEPSSVDPLQLNLGWMPPPGFDRLFVSPSIKGATREETLGARIRERMRSRPQLRRVPIASWAT